MVHSSTARKGNVETCRTLPPPSHAAAPGRAERRPPPTVPHGARRQQVDGRRQAVHGLLEGPGAGQRRPGSGAASPAAAPAGFSPSCSRASASVWPATAWRRPWPARPAARGPCRGRRWPARPAGRAAASAAGARLLLQGGQPPGVRFQRPLQGGLQRRGQPLLLLARRLGPAPLGLARASGPHVRLPLHQLLGRLHQHLGVLPQATLDELAALGAGALEAVGQLRGRRSGRPLPGRPAPGARRGS